MSEQDAHAGALRHDHADSSLEDVTVLLFHALRPLADDVKPYPNWLSFAGLFLQQIQLLGFVFSPAYNYALPIFSQLAYGVFFFSGPLFDRHYGPVGYTAYSVLLVLGFAYAILTLAVFLICVARPRVLEHASALHGLRLTMETIAGWLFIPLLHLFMGGMLCSGGSRVDNFPSARCSSSARVLNIVLGSLGMFCCTCVGLLMTFIFDHDATSLHPLSRPHGYYDMMLIVVKLILVILYHTLVMAYDKLGVFSVLAVIVYAVTLLALCVVVPYFYHSTASVCGAVLAGAACLALVNALSYFGVDALSSRTPGTRSTVVFSVLPLAAVVGWHLPALRFSDATANYIRQLRESGLAPEHVAHIPLPRSYKRRPLQHLLPTCVRDVQKDLRDEIEIEELTFTAGPGRARDWGSPLSEGETVSENGTNTFYFYEPASACLEPQVELFSPLLNKVHLPTDVEVAARFLHEYEKCTGGVVKHSAAQLSFVLQMYTDCLLYFKQSPYVMLSLAAFLFQYCGRLDAAIPLLEELQSRAKKRTEGAPGLMTRFRAFRLQYVAHHVLGEVDSAHLLALQRARTQHRRALTCMAEFWGTLLSNTNDSHLSLILVSNQLTRHRIAAMKDYRLALDANSSDRTTLRSITAFVEDVLDEKEIAQELHQAVDHLDEVHMPCRADHMKDDIRVKSALGSTILGQTVPLSSTAARESTSVRFENIEAAIQANGAGSKVFSSLIKRRFDLFMAFCIFLCLAASTVMLVVTVVHVKMATKRVEAIQEINSARAWGYRGIFYAEKAGVYYYENDCANNSAACSTDLTYLATLQKVSEAEMSMRIKHNRVSYGDLHPGFSSNTYQFVAFGGLNTRFYPQSDDGLYYSGTFSADSGVQVSFYAKVSSQLQSLSVAQGEWQTSILVSGYFTELVNRMRHCSTTYMHFLQFLTDGGADVLLTGMKTTTSAVFADAKTLKYSLLVAFILAVCFIVVGAAIGTIALHIYVFRMANERVQLTNVFSYIPRMFMEQFHSDMKRRYEVFEAAESSRIKANSLMVVEGEGLQGTRRLTMGNDSEQEDGDANDEGAAVRPQETLRSFCFILDERGNTTARRGGVNVHRSVAGLLRERPRRSSIKKGGSRHHGPPALLVESAKTRKVSFILPDTYRAGKPPHYLKEPPVEFEDTGEQIAADLVKCLAEIERETRKEKEEVERRSSSTTLARELTTNYRLLWSRIKDRLIKWNQNVALFDLLYRGVLVPLLAILAIVCMAASAFVCQKTADVSSIAVAGLGEVSLLYEHVAAVDVFDIHVCVFINFFSAEHATDVVEYVFVNEDYLHMMDNVAEQYNPEMTQAIDYISALHYAELRPVLYDTIFSSLAARAGYALGEFDITAFPYLATFFYTAHESDVVVLSQIYPSIFENTDQFTIPLLSDMPSSGPAMHREVLKLHRRQRNFDDSDGVRTALSEASEMVGEKLHERLNSITSSATVLLVTAAAAAGVCAVGCVVAICTGWKHYESQLFRATLFLVLLFAAVTLILSVVTLCRMDLVSNEAALARASLEAISFYRTSVYVRLARIEQYIHVTDGTAEAVLQYVLSYSPTNVSHYLSTLTQYAAVKTDVTVLRKLDATLYGIEEVAMFLAYAAHEKAANPSASIEGLYPASPPFIATYNFATEATYRFDVDNFGTDHPDLMYSTPRTDLLRSSDDLTDMARFAVFGERGAYYFFTTFDSIETIYTGILSSSLEKVAKLSTTNRALIISTVTSSVVMVALALFATIAPLIRAVLKMTGAERYRVQTAAVVKMSYHGVLRVFLYVVLALVLAGAGQFVIAMVALWNTDRAAHLSLNSSSRVDTVYMALAKAAYGNHAVQANSPPLAITGFHELNAAATALESTRQYLYFRANVADSSFTQISSADAAQRQLMFTDVSNVTGMTLDALMKEWVSVISSLGKFSPQLTAPSSSDSGTRTTQDVFDLSEAQKASVATQMAWLESTFEELADGLKRSDDLYMEKIRSFLRAPIVPAAVFYCVFCLCVLFLAGVVLPWLARILSREAEETRLLMKSIPTVALDAVPVVAAYVDSGVMEDTDTRSEELMNREQSPRLQRFLQKWQQMEPDEMGSRSVEMEILCQHYLDASSNDAHGALLCDSVGAVLYANTTLLKWFRHETLTGKNITVLMAPSVAKMHNRFVERYLANPQPTGPRPLDVVAYTSDGEALQVIVNVAEAPSKSGQMFFLAEIYRRPGSDIF